MTKKRQPNQLDPMHRFFLNPYEDLRFSSCPQCGGKTKIRKRPFLVHIYPDFLTILNMSGPTCLKCDLLILHQDKLEAMLVVAVSLNKRPDLLGNDYLVLGTVERSFWQEHHQDVIPDPTQPLEHLHVFKEVVRFEPAPRWVREVDADKKDNQS